MPNSLPGICGFSRNKCKIAWVSQYPNKIGVYPSQCLPSSYTIWRAVFDTQIPNATPLVEPGGTGLGFLGGGVGLVGEMLIPNVGQVKNFQSHHIVIFAKTANRLNSPHVLTKEEILSGQVNIGEYIFEAIAVTPSEQSINSQLTQAEIDRINQTGESSSDREFRKLFEQSIPDNIFKNIVTNKYGIEYRMDNGTDKAHMVLDSSGDGDLNNASYRDASSKIIQIDINTEINFIKEDGSIDKRKPKEGDTIYITYVGVIKHYIRQQVNVTWTVVDGGSTLQCYTYPTGFKVTHYRFYEWEMAKSKPTDSSTILSGWRIVESFNARPNLISMLDILDPTLGEFGVGGSQNAGFNQVISYMPANITLSRLDELIKFRNKMPSYSMEYNKKKNNISFHEDYGLNGSRDAYRSSNWFKTGSVQSYDLYSDTIKHVFYNVHPKTMQVRDVDKFGIQKYLAMAVESDYKSGKITYFPFLDNPNLFKDQTNGKCPCNGVENNNPYLNSNNCKFEPILPISEYGGNAEAVCGSVGSFGLWGFIGNPQAGISSFHAWESNFIREKFDKDTRILVERHFSAWELGPKFITIECKAGESPGVTCVSDSQLASSCCCHSNEDGFAIINQFQHEYSQKALSNLNYRPDVKYINYSSTDKPGNIENLTGIGQLTGARVNIQPGSVLSIGSPESKSLIYKTTLPNFYKGVTTSKITFSKVDDIITINCGSGYHGKIDISYILPKPISNNEIIIRYKSGSSVECSISGSTINGQSKFSINPNWIKSDSIEITGEPIKYISKINMITVVSIDSSKMNDFLENRNTDPGLYTTGNILLETDIQSLAKDDKNTIYNFFNDKNNGISLIKSNNSGLTWDFQYGIVEQINNNPSRDPFVVTKHDNKSCYLFYSLSGKILCKKIEFNLIENSDNNIVEKYTDIYTDATSSSLAKIKSSKYSNKGKSLRRNTTSSVAAGDMTDTSFWKYITEIENRLVESKKSDGSLQYTNQNKAKKYPISIGPQTAFSNKDISDSFFSAYINQDGILRLFFMGEVIQDGDYSKGEGGGGIQLQCHISNDNGLNWYDQWEYVANGYSRLKHENGESFIDTGEGHKNSKPATFGLNIHWSRVPSDKIESSTTDPKESNIINIDSPYIFFDRSSKNVFVFYIYNGILLCKYFHESIILDSQIKENGFRKLKNIIEQHISSHFVDGYLNQSNLINEIKYSNIVFQYSESIDNFDENRSINPQRVCAYSIPNGGIRIFYKISSSNNLKAAIWDGSRWSPEDFLSSSSSQFKP